jgi:hypothetical protein
LYRARLSIHSNADPSDPLSFKPLLLLNLNEGFKCCFGKHFLSIKIQSWTPKGYTRQSDWALFTLGLNLAHAALLAKSTSLTTRKKVANHSL